MVNRGTFRGAAALDPAPRKLLGDESGASAIVVGLSMTAMLGFAGLAVDASVWYADRRAVQGAADAAAYSAATNLYAGGTVTGAKANAQEVTAQDGFTNGAGGVTVTVNSPPASGPNTSNSSAVEVIVTKSESLFFSSFFQSAASVAARAVALSGSSGGAYCIWVGDPNPATSVSTAGMDLSNGAAIDVTACGAQINTPGSDALVVSGGAKFEAKTLSVVGSYTVSNGGHVDVTGTTTTGASAVNNPYGNVSTPTPNACNHNNASYGSGTQTLSPGTYCNGLVLGNGSNVTMQPGVYIIDRGTFDVSGGSKLDASAGVTIVLTSSTGSNYATPEIDNGANVTITAPSSGATSGIAMLQDPNTPYNASGVNIEGGSKMNITGALYFPSQLVNFANGSTNNSTCTQLIVDQVAFAGGSKFGNTCAGTGTTPIGSSTTTLVE